MTRTIVIGDIHGCYEELISLLDTINFANEDRVVAVGDLIVKGPFNVQVLDRFHSDSRFSSVIGNHDLAILRYWGGEEVLLKASQRQAADELQADRGRYCEYLSSLPFMIDLGSHVVVHAGLRPGVPLDRQSQEDLTELRTLGPDRSSRNGTAWFEVYNDEKVALFGHWPAAQPIIARRAIGLDTGCVYGNRLAAYIIESGEFVSVAAKQSYDKPKAALK